MVKLPRLQAFAAVLMLAPGLPALASDQCAGEDETARIREFYAQSPGTLPVIAGRRLGLTAAVVASGLDARQAASAPGEAFADVWAAMSEWELANFLIMKGQNVFEIMSGVAPGKPSTRSQYFNLDYAYPLRGHLRPDLYASIYAVALPAKNDVTVRGVMFFDADGELVFGTFVSGEALDPSPEQVRKFDAVMEQIRALPSVCPLPR